MQPVQVAIGGALCLAGVLMMIIGRRDMKAYDISNIPILSPRAKHVVGLLMIVFGIAIFVIGMGFGPRYPGRA